MKSIARFSTNFKYNPKGRTFVFPEQKATRLTERERARQLQKELMPFIDPSVMGYPKGRGLMAALSLVARLRVEKKYIFIGDVMDAFFDVCPNRLSKLLRRAGVNPSEFLIGSVAHQGREIKLRGLPQGFSTSPILWSLYISPVAKRLRRKFGENSMFYADDIVIGVESEAEAKSTGEFLKQCLAKNAYFKTAPKLNESKVRIVAPTEPLKILGVVFDSNGRLLPDSDNSASHFNAVFSAKKSVLPSKATSSARHVGAIPATRSSSYVGSLDAREGMAEIWAEKCGPAYFGSLKACSTLSREEQEYRKNILRELNQNFDALNELYYLQAEPTWILDFSTATRFFEELWLRFVRFHPCDSLTVAFYGKNKIDSRSEYKAANALYLNELRLIDDWKFFKNTIGVEQLSHLVISRKKIQQFLRGWATAKMIGLLYERKTFRVSVIKAIGTQIFPVMENLGYLNSFIEYFEIGLLNRKQFEATIKAFSEKRSKDDFILPDAIAADVLGLDHDYFRKKLDLIQKMHAESGI